MTTNTRYAGLWIRLIADFVDSTLLDLSSFLIGLIGFGGLFWVRKFGWLPPVDSEGSVLNSLTSFSAQVFLVGVRTILSLFYYTWATYRFGTTLGKRPFRIFVVAAEDHSPVSFKRSLFRCLGYVASYAPFGAGFLMVGFQPEKRGLHDLIAGTVSVVKPKSILEPSPTS